MGNNYKDLTGQKINGLEILYDSGERSKGGQVVWVVKCRCGNLFKTRGTRITKGSTQSCGCYQRKCASETRIREGKERKLGKKFHHLKVVSKPDKKCYWTVECQYKGCGKIFDIRCDALGISKTCGCLQKEVTRERLLASKPNHDSSQPTHRFAVKGYGEWKASVHERDGHTCYICGTNEHLHAHHKDGWNWCYDRRLDVNNGVTLCLACHDEFHQIYGAGNNTETQFNEFLELKNGDCK